MQMPVVVGIIVAIILLVAFTGWFYHMVRGWEEYVLDDVYFWYRIGSASVLSITIMTITFFGMAYAYDCPDLTKGAATTTLADKLNCPTFNKIKTSAEDIFKKQPAPVEKNPEEINLENETQEI